MLEFNSQGKKLEVQAGRLIDYKYVLNPKEDDQIRFDCRFLFVSQIKLMFTQLKDKTTKVDCNIMVFPVLEKARFKTYP